MAYTLWVKGLRKNQAANDEGNPQAPANWNGTELQPTHLKDYVVLETICNGLEQLAAENVDVSNITLDTVEADNSFTLLYSKEEA